MVEEDEVTVSPYVTREELAVLIQALESQRVEPMEQQFAQLMMGYAELNAAFESLLFTLFGAGDTEDAETFRKKFTEVRGGMLRWLNDAVKHVGIGGESLNAAVADLVQGQQVDSEPTSVDPGDGSGTPA